MATVASYIPIAVTTAQAVQNGEIRIKTLYWLNPTNIGDTVILQDDQGNVIWSGRCEVANQSQVFACPTDIRVKGWQVPTIASGVLYIYYV